MTLFSTKSQHSYAFLLLIIIVIILMTKATVGDQNTINKHTLTSNPGHLQPFGASGTVVDVKAINGFPEPGDFLKEYFLGSKPLLMKGASKLSPAFEKWTDSYLDEVSRLPGNENELTCETLKKENRDTLKEQEVLPLHEFVQVYKKDELYLVDNLPSFLTRDVTLPCPLQCEVILKRLIHHMMWFSSGNTSSVVHSDSYDNINCLFRGNKTLTLISPKEYDTTVLIDRPENLFSDIDVDRVDLEKYPSLAGMRFYRADMEPGDCFYIPYRWLHQVQSKGSNLAVNIWWQHYSVKNELLTNKNSGCSNNRAPCDTSLTLADVYVWTAKGRGEVVDPEEFRDVILDHIGLSADKKITILDVIKAVNNGAVLLFEENVKAANEMTRYLDINNDGFLDKVEVTNVTKESWRKALHVLGSRNFDMITKIDDGSSAEFRGNKKSLDHNDLEELTGEISTEGDDGSDMTRTMKEMKDNERATGKIEL